MDKRYTPLLEPLSPTLGNFVNRLNKGERPKLSVQYEDGDPIRESREPFRVELKKLTLPQIKMRRARQ
jgi:hypothetical protein